LLNSNAYPTCPDNMVNFGPLAAEISWRVWGTTGNFNGFRFLAALLHGTLVVGVSQTAALNRGCLLYSAGRPSRWALAHIYSCQYSSCSWTILHPFRPLASKRLHQGRNQWHCSNATEGICRKKIYLVRTSVFSVTGY